MSGLAQPQEASKAGGPDREVAPSEWQQPLLRGSGAARLVYSKARWDFDFSEAEQARQKMVNSEISRRKEGKNTLPAM